MKWQTVVVIVITAVVSLLAGQVGAWFQYRRDRDAQERRNEQENKRQEKDLASREREAEQQRRLQDTLDWRERRLAIFRDVVVASNHCIDLAYRMARSKVTEGPTGMDGAQSEMDLSHALAEIGLTSESDVRRIGAKLVDSVHKAHSSGGRVSFARSHLEAVQKAEDGNEEFQAMLAQIADRSQATVEAASAAYQEARAKFNADIKALQECHDALLEICRKRLGLTD